MRFWAVWFVVLLSVSCASHYRWEADLGEPLPISNVKPLPSSSPPASVSVREVPADITISALEELGRNHFKIENQSKEIIYINYNKSVMELSKVSHRVVPGETRVIENNREVVPMPISPGTSSDLSFYLAVNDDVLNSVIHRSGGFNLLIAVDSDKGTSYAKIDVPSQEAREPSGSKPDSVFYTDILTPRKIICYATVWAGGGYCWFLWPWAADRNKAARLAAKRFGRKVEVKYLGRNRLGKNEKIIYADKILRE